jgi:hypothetical protein
MMQTVPEVVSPPATTCHDVQDLSDIQWRQFREGLPMAAAAMAAFALASRAVSTVCKVQGMLTQLAVVSLEFIW